MKDTGLTSQEQSKMNIRILFCLVLCICIKICLGDCDNIQDTCPTDLSGKHTIFINGFPCKNPANITASDFKSSELNHPGDTDNFLRSSVTIVTAADFPGLNTLGLSVARTDMDMDGMVMPHSHPRASEIFFVSKGVVLAGFIDTQSNLFQKTLKEGDVIVFPQGLIHFCLNAGYDVAVIFSVLNSQNPGMVRIADAMFEPDEDEINKLVRKIKSLSALGIEKSTLAGF